MAVSPILRDLFLPLDHSDEEKKQGTPISSSPFFSELPPLFPDLYRPLTPVDDPLGSAAPSSSTTSEKPLKRKALSPPKKEKEKKQKITAPYRPTKMTNVVLDGLIFGKEDIEMTVRIDHIRKECLISAPELAIHLLGSTNGNAARDLLGASDRRNPKHYYSYKLSPPQTRKVHRCTLTYYLNPRGFASFQVSQQNVLNALQGVRKTLYDKVAILYSQPKKILGSATQTAQIAKSIGGFVHSNQ